MSRLQLISAIGTPLTSDESLDAAGLRAHLRQQWDAGIDGVLVAGSMGLMQLLSDGTFEALVEATAEGPGTSGRRMLIGVGETSLARTRQRLRLVNRHRFGGAVVISPFFLKFNQPDLLHYFRTLADESVAPLYLYHVPALTHAPLEPATVAELAKHPNISGIKCSGDIGYARQVIEATAGSGFEVIVASATLTDTLFRGGFEQQLDGVYALAPRWAAAIRDACVAQDWAGAAEYQRKLSGLLEVLVRYGIFPAFTALLNEQGVRGNFCAQPLRPLDGARRAAMLEEPVVRGLLAGPEETPSRGAAGREAALEPSSAGR